MNKSSPKRIEPPSTALLQLKDVKSDLQITYNDQDNDILSYMQAAESFLDGWNGFLGRCLITQTWEQKYSDFSRSLYLPLSQVTDAQVFYTGPDGAEHQIAVDAMELAEVSLGSVILFRNGFVTPQLADSRFPVRIEMVAGFGSPDEVPRLIKTAALSIVRSLLDGSDAEHFSELGPVAAAASIFRRYSV